MDQSRYLSQTLWQYRGSGQFTDVTLACADGRLTAHSALLAGFMNSFGIRITSTEEIPEVFILPDLCKKEVEDGLKVLYTQPKSTLLVEALKRKTHSDVKLEIFEDHVDMKVDIPEEKENILDPDHDDNMDERDASYSDGDDDQGGKDVKLEEQNLKPTQKLFEKPNEGELDEASDQKPTRHAELYGFRTVKDPKKLKLKTKTGKKPVGRPKGSLNSKKSKTAVHRCRKCDETFEGRKAYIEHMKEYHGYRTKVEKERELEVKCRYCSKVVKDIIKHLGFRHREEVFLNHPDIVGLLNKQCTECDDKFLARYDLNRHYKEVHGKLMKQFKCNICNEVFALRCLFRKHRKMNHLEDVLAMGLKGYVKDAPCPYCDNMHYAKYLPSHIYNVHKDKRSQHPEIIPQYSCTKCEEKFTGLHFLKHHMKKDHTPSGKCEICSKECTNQLALQNHYRIVHTAVQISSVCEFCSQEYSSKLKLSDHIKRMHSGPKEYKFPCTLCAFGYQTEERLQSHMVNNHSGSQYLCDQCPKTFFTVASRRAHVNHVHGEKNVNCDQCDATFARLCLLNEHIKKVHLKVANKVCPQCGETFNQHDQFTAHMNRHNNVRPYSCETCGKDFLTNAVLKTHMKRHTLPHNCKQCDMRFPSTTDVKKHVDLVHLGIRTECRHGCGFLSNLESNRHRHEKQCRLNPIPGAPWSVSNGTANRLTLANWRAAKGQLEGD